MKHFMHQKKMFLLQIVYPSGEVLTFPAGGRMEMDLVREITAAIMAKGVGFGKTEAQVEAAIKDAIPAALLAFKTQTKSVA